MRARSVVLAAALVATLTTSAPAAPEFTGRIAGSLGGEGGAGRTVTLHVPTAPPRSVVTDAAGRFEFDGVPPGADVEVRAEAAGCAALRVPNLRLVPGERRQIGTLTLGAAQTLRVRVVDASGAPVAGARVEAFREFAGPLDEFVERSRCGDAHVPAGAGDADEQGIAVLPLAPGAVWTVAASAKGLARVAEPRLGRPAGDELRVTLQLPPAGKLTGRVLDEAGRAVAGAIVAARRLVPQHHWCATCDPPADSAALWTRAVADATGRYELASLPPGVLEIVAGATRESMCGIDRVRVPDVGEFDVVLRATASIEGRATDADSGAPVAGVVVAAKAGVVAETARIGVTDADGRYRLDGVPAGASVTLQCVAAKGWPGFRGAASLPRDVELLPGQSLAHDLSFRRGATVHGRALRGGAPVAGAEVEVILLPAEIRGFVPCCISATTDAMGRFRIEDLWPGAAVAYAAAPDTDGSSIRDAFFREVVHDAERRRSEAFELAPGAVVERDVEASEPPPGRPRPSMEEMERRLFEGTSRVLVRGRITTADGVPPQRPQFEAEEGPASPERFRAFPRAAEPDGTFVAEVRPRREDRRITVYASDDLHDGASVTVEPEPDVHEVTVDVVLPALPRLAGCVAGYDGKPIAGAIVRCDGVVAARSASDGSFEVRATTGEHDFGVDADGWVGHVFGSYALPADEPAAFDLDRAGEISGTVVGPQGRPLAGVRIVPLDDDGDPLMRHGRRWGVAPEPLTGADGRFRLDRLPRGGSFRLRLDSPSSPRGGIAKTTTAPIECGTRDVRIEAAPARRIAGRVVGPDGEAVRNVEIACRAVAGGDEAEVKSADDGSFAFEGLAEGDHELTFTPPAARGLVALKRALGTAPEAVVVTLAAAPTIEGVLVDHDGRPVPRQGVEAVCVDEDDPTRGMDWRDLTKDTDDEGRFRIPVPAGRRFRLSLGRFNVLRDKAVLTGGESVEAGARDVRLVADTRLALGGVVVDEAGRPVAGAEVLLRIRGNERTLTTDAAGAFSVSPIAKCAVPIRVRAKGRVPVMLFGVETPKTDLRIVLAPGLTVTGTLVDADGAPATRFGLRAFSPSFPGADLWRAAMDGAGGFTIGELAEGEWFVEAYVEKRGELVERVPLGKLKAGAKDVVLRLP